jgi:hypothetical protein
MPEDGAQPRSCHRSPVTGGTPTCAVCCCTGNVFSNPVAAVLPQPGATASEKLAAWQNHEKRADAGSNGVRWLLELGSSTGGNLSLCRTCSTLLTRIDQQEFDLLESLKEFWRILDAFSDSASTKVSKIAENGHFDRTSFNLVRTMLRTDMVIQT